MLGLDNPTHILFILVVLLLLFGAKRLPELGRGLGHSIKEFKGGLAAGDDNGLEAAESYVAHSASLEHSDSMASE